MIQQKTQTLVSSAELTPDQLEMSTISHVTSMGRQPWVDVVTGEILKSIVLLMCSLVTLLLHFSCIHHIGHFLGCHLLDEVLKEINFYHVNLKKKWRKSICWHVKHDFESSLMVWYDIYCIYDNNWAVRILKIFTHSINRKTGFFHMTSGVVMAVFEWLRLMRLN